MYYPSYDDYMRDIFYFNGLQNMGQGYPYMGFQSSNLNDYFPSIYKVVYPVVQKVVSGNNYQFANEDSVNNIVDVVLGITAGDINTLENVGNNSEFNRRQTQGNQTGTSNSSNNSEASNNQLLKDLIKILTIKELQSRQNIRRFPYTYGSNVPYLMNQFGG